VAVDERALNELRDLARRDGRLEAEAAALRASDAEVGSIRAAAEAIASFFAGYEAERAVRAADRDDAKHALDHRRDELAQAELDATAAREDAAREHAEKAVRRARDHVEVAEARLARADDACAELEAGAASLPSELKDLDARARGVAHVPPPEADLIDWASRAHAELFVAAGQLDVQREQLIREANELASMLIGEATYGSTAAQAVRQVERYWTSSPGHVSESR
jgi:hypothetical protein